MVFHEQSGFTKGVNTIDLIMRGGEDCKKLNPDNHCSVKFKM
jgi:hypothetical protein